LTFYHTYLLINSKSLVPEEKIIRNCLKGDRRSQKELYERYKHSFFMLVQRYTSSRDEAQDFLQEGFIKIFRDLHQFDSSKGSFYTWGRRVIVNTALQHIRKRRILISETEIEDYNESFSAPAEVTAALDVEDLTRMISSLPIGYRVVFNMFVIEGYSHQEIAEQLSISESTSKSQLFKAKKALRKKIDRRDLLDKAMYESR